MKSLLKMIEGILVGGIILYSTIEESYFYNSKTYKEGIIMNIEYIKEKSEEKEKNSFILEKRINLNEIDSIYTLKIKSEDFDYSLNIKDSQMGIKKDSIKRILKVGDKIKFETGNKKWNNAGDTIYFSNFINNKGKVYSNNIKILKNKLLHITK